MLKAIVFDFDGILVDSEPVHFEAFREVGRSLGYDFDYQHYLDQLIGFDDRDAFDYILRSGGAVSTKAPKQPNIATLCDQKQRAFERLVQRGIDPIPGAVELVDAAARRMPIAIASGATMTDITLMLDQLGRRGVFEIIVSADQVQRSKPDPESYAMAVDRLAQKHPELALGPANCLAIEDTPAGVASARDAGLMTLGVASTGPAEKLHEAMRVTDTLEGVGLHELREWFASERGDR